MVCAIVTIAADERVLIEQVSAEGGLADFTVRNVSPQIVAYFHWFTLDSSPVPYCQNPDGSIYVCALKVIVDDHGNPWTHELYLKPGDTVRFRARVKGAVAVGIKLWLDGKESYVWYRLHHDA